MSVSEYKAAPNVRLRFLQSNYTENEIWGHSYAPTGVTRSSLCFWKG